MTSKPRSHINMSNVSYIDQLQLHENGRKIVGQQLPTLMDATCCVRLDISCSCCVVPGVVAQSLKPIKCLAMSKHLQHCCPTTLNIVRLYVALDSLDAYIIWPRQITRQTVVFIKKGRFSSRLVLFCGASYQSNNHLLKNYKFSQSYNSTNL